MIAQAMKLAGVWGAAVRRVGKDTACLNCIRVPSSSSVGDTSYWSITMVTVDPSETKDTLIREREKKRETDLIKACVTPRPSEWRLGAGELAQQVKTVALYPWWPEFDSLDSCSTTAGLGTHICNPGTPRCDGRDQRISQHHLCLAVAEIARETLPQYSGRREPAPASCPVSPTCTPWCLYAHTNAHVGVYIQLPIYVHAYIHFISTCVYIHVCAHSHIHAHPRTYIYTSTCSCTYSYTCMCMHTHAYIHFHKHMFMYIQLHMYVHANTHSHE